MIIRSLELGGVRRMENTSETLKCQKPLIQGFRHNAKSHTEVTRKGKSCKQTWECVSTANGLINIVTEESVLACLDLSKPFGLEKDTSAYGLGVMPFQRRENRQKRSMDYFSVALRRAGRSHDNQKKEKLIIAIRLYFWVHSLGGSLHETIIWANYADLQSHYCPQRTNTRVTQVLPH
jgi:hypothetical protein